MKGPDGQNAVQLLLLVGGLTLIPALLFCVTAFTRIIIVLGFIRQGLGTQSAPPNQVLVGIALFLTIFVMAPTFSQIKKDAIDPLQKHKITQAQAFERGQEPLREFMFRQTRTTDLALFVKLGKVEDVKTRKDVPGLPDRLLDLPAVPGHRPRRELDADVDGHGDAAARLHLAAVQDPALRPGRRLEPRHPIARGELPLMGSDTVLELSMQALELTLRVALPLLLVGLVVGLAVSIFQAVTQIQEQTLAFIPKILALAGVLIIGGPWMLNQLLSYTTDLWSRIPTLVG
jgi:flagellar biosynthetic protein FliQ